LTPPKICTIGYEGAAIEDLISTLKKSGITHIVDVRQSPYSKRSEFSKDQLSSALANYDISYTHIRALGNPPAGREALRVGHVAVFHEVITAHLEGDEAQAALRQVLSLIEQKTVCLMCMEKAPRHCHRSLVAAKLNALSGCEIEHLYVKAKAPHPDQAPFDF
jgi:uncharacterized protein (DUF488 family)